MIDLIFSKFIDILHLLPNITVSLLNYVFCIFTIYIVNKYFKNIGLCCYSVLCGIIANIQFLYPIKYEIINLNTFLGSFVFSTTFLVTDIINKQYGKESAMKSICFTLTFEIFFLINMLLTIGHTSISQERLISLKMTGHVESIQNIFLPVPRILISSYISYFISQMAEVFLLRKINNNIIKHNIILFISTILLDNIIFSVLALCIFAEQSISLSGIIQVIMSSICIRMLCNFLNTVSYKILCKI